MVVKNSYDEVKAVVFHAMDRLFMYSRQQEYSVFLYILHFCRHKLFVDYQSEYFRRDSVLGIFEGILQSSDTVNYNILRELHKIFEEDILSLNKDTSTTFYDTVFLLMEISNESYNKYYNRIFDDVLDKLSSSHRNFSIQPKEISQFISKLSGYNEKKGIVYNPFAGYASYGKEMMSHSGYFAQELDSRIWAVGTLRLLANDINTYNYVCADSILEWEAPYNKIERNKHYFDYILATPPFGYDIPYEEFWIEPFRRKCNAEEFFIARGLEGLNPTGKLLGLFSTGVLFNNGSIKDLRQYAVENDYLDMVISMPVNILAPLTGVNTVILVFSKNKNLHGTVRFIDGSSFYLKNGRSNVLQVDAILAEVEKSDSNFVKYVSKEEIAENDFDLTVGRYFIEKISVPEGFSLVKLADLVETYRGKRNGEGMGKVVKGGDLSSDSFNFEKKYDDLMTDIIKPNYMAIDRDVLLISSIRELKPTYYSCSSADEITYCIPSIYAFLVKSDLVDESYLINELNKEYVQKQALFAGSVLPRITEKSLLSIEILIPIVKEQQRVIVESAKQTYQSALIREMGLEKLISKQKLDFIEELRIKKHNLNQYLGNFRNNVSALSKYLKRKGIQAEFISEQRKITVEKHLDGLIASVSEMSALVEQLTKEFTFGESQNVDLNDILESYENSPLYSKCKIEYIIDGDTIKYELEDGSFIISSIASINEHDLREVINHILTNAIIHGFADSETTDGLVQLRLSFDSESNMYIIEFRNNGNSLPKGMDTHKYGIKGEKAGKTGNDGIGGFRVKSIIEHFGGSYEIMNEPSDSLFKVNVIVKLNKAIENENI